MTLSPISAELRTELVRAAETVLDKQGGLPRNPENAQLARLVQVASEAVCAEEVENYLRYQGARGRWKRTLAEEVIAAVSPLLQSLGSDAERVLGWRLYATYLRRGYVYRREVNRDMERARRKDGPGPRGAAPRQGQGAAPAGADPSGKPREKRRSRRRGRRSGAPGEAAEASGEAVAGELPLEETSLAAEGEEFASEAAHHESDGPIPHESDGGSELAYEGGGDEHGGTDEPHEDEQR
jgi:hypothetical protein